MRNTWIILNSFLRCSRKPLCRKFTNNGVTITDPQQIANEFNQYFANVGPSLASSIKHTGKDFNSYLQSSNNFTCFFGPSNEEEIVKIIGKLGSRKSPGCAGIKSDLKKQVADEISLPLKIIFNVSLQKTGIVPDDIKVAKVVPIYKKDNPEIFSKYRPV